MGESLLACGGCGFVHSAVRVGPQQRASCRRCGADLPAHRRGSLHRAFAFSLAAILLYWPANVFPIMRMSMYGAPSEATVWSGVVRLYKDGDPAIALVVFLASIVVPLLKLAGLLSLCAFSYARSSRWRRARAAVFRFIEGIGRWAMLDVFVLAILVSMFKLKKLAEVTPGPGALPFVGVVVLTLLASRSFDARLIWEDEP